MLRRLLAPVAVAASLLLGSCGGSPEPGMRMIVLGIDGMDYDVARELIEAGRMPNFARLAEQGSFTPLETAIPPQSPVAWSNMMTGMDSGGHGIFDFLHRDPETMLPLDSMLNVEGEGFAIKVGRYQFPLSGGAMELNRRGRTFWEVLENHGIESTIMRMPVNFPPIGEATRELSGMGTKDLKGYSGEYSFYTSRRFAVRNRNIDSGLGFEVEINDNVVEAELHGPPNPFLQPDEETGVSESVVAPFTVYIDPEDDVVKLTVGDEERVLREGEWSDWIPVTFDLIPTQAIGAMARFYLKSVRPDLQIYVTPIDIDPMAPAAPISHPSDFAAELAEATGRYYTEEMPEDAKARIGGFLSFDEYLTQAGIAGDEVIEQYYYSLENFNNGFLFYYFGNLDQVSHVMWHTRDPEHPAHDPARDAQYANVIDDLYISYDRIIGDTLAAMGEDDVLIVMSDHGFGPFRRAFNVNAWLVENGYMTLIDTPLEGDNDLGLINVDWSQTQAYNFGLNALYLNVAGRESQGIVPPAERQALIDEIDAALRATVDPATGMPAVTQVYQRDRVFSDGDRLATGPDIIIGWTEGVRTLGLSASGAVLGEVFTDNLEDWSGDHEWDHTTVPGVFFSSRPLKQPAASLLDVASTILTEFDIDEPVQPD
jgi:predicted AlkP superfamily phosphohydrolase/phosphomutase